MALNRRPTASRLLFTMLPDPALKVDVVIIGAAPRPVLQTGPEYAIELLCRWQEAPEGSSAAIYAWAYADALRRYVATGGLTDDPWHRPTMTLVAQPWTEQMLPEPGREFVAVNGAGDRDRIVRRDASAYGLPFFEEWNVVMWAYTPTDDEVLALAAARTDTSRTAPYDTRDLADAISALGRMSAARRLHRTAEHEFTGTMQHEFEVVPR